ncbi:hypothetical protein BaRGS_00004360, partial [Batillaria attramentaria]
CPNSSMLALVNNAIIQGDITWHAAPMNMQYEFYSANQLDFSLNISRRLDKRFNITRQHPVISLRDVPGLTKAVIPILQKHNISGVSVGVNSGQPGPAVPNHPFLWKLDEEEETGVVAFWHPGGYPLGPGAFPNGPGGLSRKDCHIPLRVSEFPEALCFAFRQDNQGPPESATEVLANYEVARGQFRNAMVQGSSLDAYVTALLAAKATLPQFDLEIGDPWIHGVSSDPVKTAQYRAFCRVFDKCMETGRCSGDDPRVVDAVRYLTKIPEHTWGLIRIPDGNKNVSNDVFRKQRAVGTYRNWETSWEEQRAFLGLALTALGDHPVVQDIVHEYTLLQPAAPDLSDYSEADLRGSYNCSDGTIMGFGPDGALYNLYDPYNKALWADDQHALGLITYSTYNNSAYIDSTLRNSPENKNSGGGYGDGTYPYPFTGWFIHALTLYKRKGSEDTCDFWVKLAPQDLTAVREYGSPETFYIHYQHRARTDSTMPGIDVDVQWFDKEPTRLTESISVLFNPPLLGNSTWLVSKLGHMIDPSTAVTNGSHYIHAVDRSMCLMTPEMQGLEILSPDVALAMLGTDQRTPGPYPQPYGPPSGPFTYAGFNLFNNFWKTNYLFWYPFKDRDNAFKARFAINFVTGMRTNK